MGLGLIILIIALIVLAFLFIGGFGLAWFAVELIFWIIVIIVIIVIVAAGISWLARH